MIWGCDQPRPHYPRLVQHSGPHYLQIMRPRREIMRPRLVRGLILMRYPNDLGL